VALVNGRVIDVDGQPVAQATVYVVSSPRPLPDIAQVADDSGVFAMALRPGVHVIGARSDSAGSGQTTVEVPDDTMASVIVEVTLRAPAR
jgi:hypothetical protein